MLTHRNLASNAVALVDAWGFTRGDVLLHALPIYHVHGLFVALHCALLSGGRVLWLPKFDAKEVLRLLPRATVMMGVPTFYTRLLAEPGSIARACANVRLFIAGSAPLLPETFREFEQRTGHRVLERYGMTETGMNRVEPAAGRAQTGLRRSAATRRLDPRRRCRREACATGTIGEIEVNGPERHAGLLEPAGQDRGVVHARTAGSGPATSARSTTTAILRSSGARRT